VKLKKFYFKTHLSTVIAGAKIKINYNKLFNFVSLIKKNYPSRTLSEKSGV
jgi:hypothetical protein